MHERTLILVDDNDDFRRSTEWLLDAEGIHVTSYRSGLTALDALKDLPAEHAPSCLLLDVRMPDISGPELHRRLIDAGQCGKQGLIQVVYLTGHGDVPLAVASMEMGAVTFLEKPLQPASLMHALARAFERHDQARAAWQAQADEAAKIEEAGQVEQRIATLTEREFQVLAYLWRGLMNKEIAQKLDLSHKTVEVYRARVMNKLGLRSHRGLTSCLAEITDPVKERFRALI